MSKKIVNDHPIAEFSAKSILWGTGLYVFFIAAIAVAGSFHWI